MASKRKPMPDLSSKAVWINQFIKEVKRLHAAIASDIKDSTAEYLYAKAQSTPEHAAQQYVFAMVSKQALKGE